MLCLKKIPTYRKNLNSIIKDTYIVVSNVINANKKLPKPPCTTLRKKTNKLEHSKFYDLWIRQVK